MNEWHSKGGRYRYDGKITNASLSGDKLSFNYEYTKGGTGVGSVSGIVGRDGVVRDADYNETVDGEKFSGKTTFRLTRVGSNCQIKDGTWNELRRPTDVGEWSGVFELTSATS